MAEFLLPTYFSLHRMRFCRLSRLLATPWKDHQCMSMYTSLTWFTSDSCLRKTSPSWVTGVFVTGFVTGDSLAVSFHQQSPHSRLSAPSHVTSLSGFQNSEIWRGCVFGSVSAFSYQEESDEVHQSLWREIPGWDVSRRRHSSSELVSLLCLPLLSPYSSILKSQYTSVYLSVVKGRVGIVTEGSSTRHSCMCCLM